MELLSHKGEPVLNESLETWTPVCSGGFGRVYKSRHKDWGFDVAIKILHDGVCPVLLQGAAVAEETNHMERASCEFVLRLYGIYQGCPPLFGGTSLKQGIVMEFMERGSVQALLEDLSGPPPWPLVFRLAHQVALGMNFLHSRSLMHLDLKPSNVLLNDDLNAKLADFGLCRVSASARPKDEKSSGLTGGSYRFMPPEAFETSYEPVRAYDSYSYGVLLWCIATGKEPYPAADFSLVALRIPLGDRPPSEQIDSSQSEGLSELVHLMRKCWVPDPCERPTFKVCLTVTENLSSKHKKGVHRAVNQVLTKLDSPGRDSQFDFYDTANSSPKTPDQGHVSVVGRFKENKSASMQVSSTLSVADKAKFVDDKKAQLIQGVSEVMAIAEDLGDMVHQEVYAVIQAKLTSQEKVRTLYLRTLRSGGETVKAAFYDALQKHHPALVQRLDG